MPLDFATAPCGRRAETDAIFRRFDAGKNLLMPGLRRLGKTFVLHRLEERAAAQGYVVVSFDVSHRHLVSDHEAVAIVTASGWLSAYYLEAFGKQLQGSPAVDADTACARVADARKRLLQPVNRNYFETWPEHIRKNFAEPARNRLFALLACLAEFETGLSADGLLHALNDAALPRRDLLRLLNTLEEDGFIVCDREADRYRFRMELLRLWWQRYLPE